ncbi:MAG: hypothetical protein GX345_00510 [Clostridiales bacterium]|nr:hypothetical protein [Clostridiales bacterium]
MKKGRKLQFKTKKRLEAEKKKRLLLIFFIFFFLFSAASLLFFLRSLNFDLSNILDKQPTGPSSQESSPTLDDIGGFANILVFSASSDKNEKDPLRFICLINADLEQGRIRVAALSPQTGLELNGQAAGLTEHFKLLGPSGFKQALEELTGLEIDRYAFSDDTGFKKAMRVVDPASRFMVDIRATIDYKGDDYSLFLPPGERTINADSLLKYLRYQGSLGQEGLKAQAQTIANMLEVFINEKNLAKNEVTFEELYNAITQTDISSFDFHKALPALEAIAHNKELVKISVEQDTSLFSRSRID